MRIESSFLSTRVARRMFVLFIVAAVLPVVAVWFVSFRFVTGQIERQSESQLRQAAKTAAMTVFERLTEREAELISLAATHEILAPDGAFRAPWPERLRSRYKALFISSSDGAVTELLPSESPPPPELLALCADRGSRLRVSDGGRIFLAVPGPEGRTLLAELDTRQLLQPEQGSGFVGADDFLVFDGNGALLFASLPEQPQFVSAAARDGRVSHSGTLEWASEDGDHVAASWMLFLKARFDAASWRFFVSSPKVEIFATATTFKATLFLVVLLCLAAALLISASQIRRTMKPLETLRAATERISAGDYSTRVEVTQGDEFALLSRSFNDMSARVSQQFAEIVASRDAAQQASRAKSDFLAMMSHEIRTPMNGILGMSELALTTNDAAEMRESLHIVKSSAESLLSVIKNILDFAAIERGEVELVVAPFLPRAEISDAARLFASQAAAKNLELNVNTDRTSDAWLSGDVSRIRHVVAILVANALKFTTEGSIDVEVEVERNDGDRALLMIAVEDTGIGISPAKMQLVFDAFTQSESYMRRRHGGTGLGLATAKALVERMGGRLWADSSEGVGSTFHIELELPVAEAPCVTGHAPCAAAAAGPGPALSRGRVLVAEDNEINQKVVEKMLAREHVSVLMVANGREAVEACSREDFDLVLMDLQMPLLDGLEATEIILRERRPGRSAPPIVALTAHASSEDAARCLSAGMVGVLTKPLSTDRLREMLVAHLALPSR